MSFKLHSHWLLFLGCCCCWCLHVMVGKRFSFTFFLILSFYSLRRYIGRYITYLWTAFYTKCFPSEWIKIKYFVIVVIAVTFLREMIKKCWIVEIIAIFLRDMRRREMKLGSILKRVGEKMNVKYLQLLTESRSGLLLMELNWYLYYIFFLSCFFY